MTTTELHVLLDTIAPMLLTIKQCIDDSELDEHHAVSDHYDCEQDLHEIANLINAEVS